MITFALVTLAVIFLLAMALYSGCEMGLYCINRIRLRLRSEHEPATNARLLLHLIKRQEDSVLSLLLWQSIAGYLLTVATTAWLGRVWQIDPHHIEFYAALILVPVAFASDVAPKTWFQIEADRLMYAVARVLYASVAVIRMTGIVWLLELVPRLIARLIPPEDRERWKGPRGEVVGLLREGAAEGAMTEEQTHIVERILSLSATRVGSLMIPRARVLSVPIEATEELFRHVVRRHPFTHLPVLATDRHIVLGIVNVNKVLADEAGYSLERHLRPAVEVYADQSAAKALVQLQQENVTLANVVDPRRGFVGIIALTDIVEEIFGELS